MRLKSYWFDYFLFMRFKPSIYLRVLYLTILSGLSGCMTVYDKPPDTYPWYEIPVVNKQAKSDVPPDYSVDDSKIKRDKDIELAIADYQKSELAGKEKAQNAKKEAETKGYHEATFEAFMCTSTTTTSIPFGINGKNVLLCDNRGGHRLLQMGEKIYINGYYGAHGKMKYLGDSHPSISMGRPINELPILVKNTPQIMNNKWEYFGFCEQQEQICPLTAVGTVDVCERKIFGMPTITMCLVLDDIILDW